MPTLTAKEFAAKYSNKIEIQRFLAVDLDAYLCHHRCMTCFHYRDLTNGRRKVIKALFLKIKMDVTNMSYAEAFLLKTMTPFSIKIDPLTHLFFLTL
jgi:hypothetical protein